MDCNKCKSTYMYCLKCFNCFEKDNHSLRSEVEDWKRKAQANHHEGKIHELLETIAQLKAELECEKKFGDALNQELSYQKKLLEATVIKRNEENSSLRETVEGLREGLHWACDGYRMSCCLSIVEEDIPDCKFKPLCQPTKTEKGGDGR